MKDKGKNIYTLACLAAIAYLLFFYESSSKAVLGGLTLWVENVLPSLYPMFVISRFMLGVGAAEKISRLFRRPAKYLFGLGDNCSFAYVSSMLSGYPAGTKTVCDMYAKDIIGKRDAFVLLCLCSNSSAVFLISTVGAVFFKSVYIGVILLISNYVSAFLSGLTASLIYPRNRTPDIKQKPHQPGKVFASFSEAVINSSVTIINVGAFIVFFSVVISALEKLFILIGLGENSFIYAFITGITEVTSGAKIFSEIFSRSPALSVTLCASAAAFGGLCIFFQSLSFISDTDLNAEGFLLFKIYQGFLAGAIAFVIFRITNKPAANVFLTQKDLPAVSNNALLFSFITVIIVIIWIIAELVYYAKIGKRNAHGKGCVGGGGNASGEGADN